MIGCLKVINLTQISMFNKHFAQQDQYAMRERNFQEKLGVNVLVGIVGNAILVSIVLKVS